MNKRLRILLISCIMLALLTGCNSDDRKTPKEVSSEYSTFLTDHNIPDVDYMESFLPLHEITLTNSYVMKDSDGIITIQQFAASEDGTVCIDAYALYYPVADYTQEEKEALDTSIKQSFAEVEKFDFSSISSSIGENYYEIVVCLHHLNNYDNYLAAAKAEYYEEIPEEDTLMDFKTVTDRLLEEGYIAKYSKNR